MLNSDTQVLKVGICCQALMRCIAGGGGGGAGEILFVNSNDCQMFCTINRPCLCIFLCAAVSLCVYILVKTGSCSLHECGTMAAPVHASLYLILLVAVFVCVVPLVQPVLSVLRYSITGSQLFRCAQVSSCCDWDVCISHCPPLSDNVLSVSDRGPASCPQSFSLDTHTHMPTVRVTHFLLASGVAVRLGCYALACGLQTGVGLRGICVCLCVFVVVIMAA